MCLHRLLLYDCLSPEYSDLPPNEPHSLVESAVVGVGVAVGIYFGLIMNFLGYTTRKPVAEVVGTMFEYC